MFEKFELNETEKVDGIDFKEMHNKCLVDVSLELPPPPVALSIGTYAYKDNVYPIPFGTYGNFSCLVGASKSMKTFLKSALIAGYIGGQSSHYFPDLKGHNIRGKFVIDVDTEQSLWHTQRVARRVCEMVGANYGMYKPFTTREYDAKIRFQFIEWIMMESEYRNDIGLITIDGAADIMDSVNDLDEANKITQGMMKWTTKSNAHLSTILHRNHGSDKPTGHLGSSIMKKAETVAFVTRDDELTKVTPNYCRNHPFNEFHFELDTNYLPIINNVKNAFI
ncbi:MAG: AAA family ATPase [Colwellia sp.]|nr:AAA family ATPase [Colwellia sp.]